MAWVTKYTIEQKNKQTGLIWRAHIQEDAAVFDSNIPPAAVPFEINWRCDTQDADWVFAPSIATVRFIDDETGVLTSIFNAGHDERYRLIITEDNAGEVVHWQGFIDPESYSFGYLSPNISQIQATDRLRLLKNVAYESAPGVPYTGQERFSTIVSRCLAQTNVGIGIGIHATRYSYLATNALSDTPGSSDDPLYYHTVDQSAYLDDAGNSMSCWDVLKDICKAWGLQVFQGAFPSQASRWLVMDRHRIVQGAPPELFDIHKYTTAGVSEGFTSGNAKIAVSTTSSDNLKFQIGAVTAAQAPIGSASYIYNHRDGGQIWKNLGFEDELTTGWTVTGVGWDRSYFVNDPPASVRSLDTPIEFNATPATAPVKKINQTASTNVAGANGDRVRLSFWVYAPQRSDLPAGRDFFLYWSMKAGTKYWKRDTNTWETIGVLTDQQILNAYSIPAAADSTWVLFNLTSDVLDGISGSLIFEIREGVEEDDTGGQTQFELYVDSVEIDVIDSSGQVLKAARQTTTVITSTTNDADENIQSQVGEGPFEIFPGAIRQKDNLDADIGLGSDWDHGVPGAATGYTFDQLNCFERIKQYREPARTIAGTIISTATLQSTELRPSDLLLIERPDSTTQEDYMWYRALTWRPANPVSAMTGSWATIQDLTIGDTSTSTLNLEDVDTSTGGSIKTFNSVVTVIGGAGIRTVASKTALTAEDVGSELTTVVLENYTAGIDGGGGVFVGDPADTTTPTNLGTVFADPSGKRWKRLAALNGEPWSPKWFGARFDGSTDDSTAFQNTFDAAPPGTSINLPAGRSRLASQVTIDNKAHLIRGSSESWYKDDQRTGWPTTEAGTVLESTTALTGAMFLLQDTISTDEKRNATIFENIHFVGNTSKNPGQSWSDSHAIEVLGGIGVQVRYCQINDFASHGISILTSPVGNLVSPTGCTIERVNISECGGYGLFLEGFNHTVSRCIIDNNALGGISENTGAAINFLINNQITGNAGTGIELFGQGVSMVRGNFVSGNSGGGIIIDDLAGTPANTIITDNNVYFNGTDTNLSARDRSGIVVNGAKDTIVTNNACTGNGTYGVYLEGQLSGVTLSGNQGSDNGIDFSNTRTQKHDGRYNVIEYGLIQRSNDASILLQALIDSVPVGATIFFPEGDYTFFNQVQVNKQVRLLADGVPNNMSSGGAYLKADLSLNAPILSLNANGITLDGIKLVGNLGAASSAADGLWIAGTASNITITLCAFLNFVGSGIDIQTGASNIIIDKCWIRGSIQNGVFARGSDISIHQCIVEANTVGIYAFNTEGLKITATDIINNTQRGIILDGAIGTSIVANSINGHGWQGIRIGLGGANVITGNWIEGNGVDTGAANAFRAGIEITQGDGNLITANTFGDQATTATQLFAISTGANVGSATILNNREDGNLVTGFYDLDSTSAGNLDIDLEVTATLDLASLASGATNTATVTVTGARDGDAVKLGPPANWNPDVITTARVSSNDTVTLHFYNASGSAIDQPSGDWAVYVERRKAATAVINPGDPPPTGLSMIFQHIHENKNLLKYS